MYVLVPTKKKNDEIYHYGVLGMKWGVRRNQNSGGTLTSTGGRRDMRSIQKSINKYEKRAASAYGRALSAKDFQDSYNDKYEKAITKNNIKKAEKFLKKSENMNKTIQEAVDDFKSNSEQLDKAKEIISKNSNYMIHYKRGEVTSGGTSDGALLVVGYDKSKVRKNTEKNRTKYAKKTNPRGYDVHKERMYVY